MSGRGRGGGGALATGWGCYARGCDHVACRQEASRRVRQYRTAAHERGLPAGDPRHGTVGGHDYWGCGCVPCKAAKAASRSRGRGLGHRPSVMEEARVCVECDRALAPLRSSPNAVTLMPWHHGAGRVRCPGSLKPITASTPIRLRRASGRGRGEHWRPGEEFSPGEVDEGAL